MNDTTTAAPHQQRFLLQCAAEDYRNLGLSPLPLDGKTPNVSGWPDNDYSDEEIGEHLQRADEPGIGVKMGPIIDVEWDTESQKEKALELFGGELPKTPCFNSRKGAHYLFQGDDRFTTSTISIPCDDGTNLIVRVGPGAQSAFPPSPNKEWVLEPGEFAFQPIPELLMAELLERQAPSRAVSARPHDLSGYRNPRVAEALGHIPAGEHDVWVRIGLALKNEGEHYFNDWCGWSLTSEKSEGCDLEAKWEGFKPNGSLSLGTVFHLARENGWQSEIRNCDGDGKPLPMGEIVGQLRAQDLMPSRVGNQLFIDDPEHGIYWVDTVDSLFGWLHDQTTVFWGRAVGSVTKGELLADLRRIAPAFDSISELPHYPEVPGIYYASRKPQSAASGKLDEFVGFFNPASAEDRELIKAAVLTLFWGGPPGSRPMHIISASSGRGSGKTALVEALRLLAGDYVKILNSEIEKLARRLLSPEAVGSRIIFYDNVKGKIDCAGFEDLITSSTISGHRLHVGEGRVPNLFTWFVTANGVDLATDGAQRAVIIKLAKPDFDPDWWRRLDDFVNKNREAIIGDCLATLSADGNSIGPCSRWAAWEKSVLACCQNPSSLQQLILERQGEADADADEAKTFEDSIAAAIEAKGYDPDTCHRLSQDDIGYFFEAAFGAGVSKSKTTRTLKRLVAEGQIVRLSQARSGGFGRHWLWNCHSGEPSDELFDSLRPSRSTHDFLNN